MDAQYCPEKWPLPADKLPPKPVRGASLAASNIRTKYGVTVVGVKSPGGAFKEATPETVISNHDLIIVSGDSRTIEKFAALEG